jgi:hypothetical protein
MSHKNHHSDKAPTRRPIVFVLLGVLLFAGAALLITDRLQPRTSIAPPPQTYRYSTRQSLANDVQYHQTSFFSGNPGPSNNAYLASITDTINTQLHYSFNANDATDLRYTYDATAVVHSVYGSRDGNEGAATVWSQKYTLLKPVHGTQKTASLSLNPKVEIPFTEYRQRTEQFKNAFSAPLTNEAIVTLTVRVSGKINDTPFDDRKVSTVTVPLDQQVYKLAAQYTGDDQHEVIPAQSMHLADLITRYEVAVAAVLIAGGLACTIYGIRKQIIKSPHQREVEKIYRYHNGIIIKASRPTNLANKNVVMVQSFEDLLNIEEEIKTPIIASKVSNTSTHFLITRDDIVYVYTLGDQIPFKPSATGDKQYAANRPPEYRPKVGG